MSTDIPNNEPTIAEVYGPDVDRDMAIIAQHDAIKATNPVAAANYYMSNRVHECKSRVAAAITARNKELGIEAPPHDDFFDGRIAADRLRALRPAGKRDALEAAAAAGRK